MSNEKFLKKCDDQIEKARREYQPTSIWDEPSAPKEVIEEKMEEPAEDVVNKTINILEEMGKKHLKNYGLMKIVGSTRKMVMWGMNPLQAEIAQKALTTKRTSATFEIVVHA